VRLRPGPTLWVSAAIHGDELNGVEIIRELIQRLRPREMCGAVIAVPIVNVFGFVNEKRELPDRRAQDIDVDPGGLTELVFSA